MHLRNSSRARRGSILIVVIGLLALFAVVGLSFVLYADAEATAARSARAARNADELPDPAIPAQDFLRQFIFDSNNNTSMMLGHGLLTSRFAAGSNVPFTGTGIPSEQVAANGVPFDRRLLVNYALGATKATPTFNWYTNNASAPFSKAVPWTYPDTNNFYLAWLNPATGKVEVPSFHRPDVFGDLGPTNPKWNGIENALLTLRPHPSIHPNFPRVPANPDGTYTGDVSNLKFMTGSQTNDSLWMYAGSPVQEWRGRKYVAMVAPLVLDLSNRVNLSVAGNIRGGSTHGFGPWEIDPVPVLGVANSGEINSIINARNALTIPYDRNKGISGTTGVINLGRNSSNPNEVRTPPFYSLLDTDALGVGAPPEYPTLPAAMSTVPFPTYPSRFETTATTAAALNNHPSMFNPFQWQRGSASGLPHGFGMDDLVKLASRYNDPKNRYNTAEIAKAGVAPNSMANADVRHLTTMFSVSQRWGRLPVNGGAAYVGPIDLNRPLPDYRMDPTKPLSSTNIVTGAQLTAADNARQNLAMDIFVRLLAVANMVDGTTITYAANTGRVTFANAPTPQMKQLAQFAVNIVDYIDGDDIMTGFIWHDNTDVVWGTELPKLVVNEAYSAMFNADADSAPDAVKTPLQPDKYPAKQAVKKNFWVELHNPLKSDTTLPDSGAARLFDTNGNINCYEIVIGEDGGANGTSYSTFLQNDPAAAAQDPSTGGITIKVRVNQFNNNPANGKYNATLGGAECYLVQPTDGATAVANANKGYFVVGPPDRTVKGANPPINTFPDKQDAALTYSFVPTGGQNSMQYDATTVNVGPTDQDILNAKNKKHTVLLRRLANPYVATAAGTNPFVTVDVVEAVPTHDRVEYNRDDKRNGFMPEAEGTIGKRHPYASGFYAAGAAGQPALALQTNAGGATPPHTFFLQNSNLDNVNNGLAWLAHLDRELVNATEILQTSIYSPGLLTTRFYNANLPVGTNYNQHYHSPTGTLGNLLDLTPQTGGYVLVPQGYKAFDILTVASRLPGVPLGGREPGLVNLNTVNDPRVWNALADPQAGNSFTSGFSGPAWFSLSTGANGRTTILNNPAISDKPFQPGTSLATASMEQTVLRSNGTGTPILFNQTPTNGNHDYFKSEPLRKIMNNTTTVTDGFLVIWTVGFFELDTTVTPNPSASGPIIGKELFERVPGDLRSQFTAVVDRSMVTVDNIPSTKLGNKPAETKTTEDAPQGTNQLTVQGTAAGIYLDGNLVPLTGTMRLGLGDAASGTGDGEWVAVGSAVPNGIPGQVTLTITPTAYYHGAGTRLSNGLLGAPTPTQVTTFNPTDPANRHIVPYYIRLQP